MLLPGGSRPTRIGLRQLHGGHSDDQRHQGGPLRRKEFLPQNDHRKNGRRQDFQLIGHLVGGRVQMRRRNVQQVVLQDVQKRGHANLERIERLLHDGAVQGGLKPPDAFALLHEHQHQAGEQFDHFGHHDRRGTEEHCARPGSRIAHAKAQYGILQR